MDDRLLRPRPAGVTRACGSLNYATQSGRSTSAVPVVTSPLSATKSIASSLEISWKEGIVAAVMYGITEYYVIPYGLFLGATAQQIGWLVAIPYLLASLSQLLAARAVQWVGSRLRFLVASASLQAVLLVPMAGLVFWPAAWRMEILLVLMVGFRVVNNLIVTTWGSLMSDYLPAEKRGGYFGWRSRVVGVAGVFGMMCGGLLLFTTKASHAAMGFCLLFLVAALCRGISAALLSRMADLPMHHTPEDEFTFLMFVRRFRESNFVRFVVYVASITFATFLAAPYFSVYMLRDLHWNYLMYMAVHLAGVLASLVAFPIWGRHADVVGNANILKITSLLLPLIPLGWLVSRNPVYLMSVEFFSGFVWGGFNLCATNFIYDSVSPSKRVRCLGYFTVINGVAMCAGAFLGGILAERIAPVAGFRLLSVFLLSGLLRFAAHFVLSRHFQEVRDSARAVSSRELFFSVIGVRPLAGLHRESSSPVLSVD